MGGPDPRGRPAPRWEQRRLPPAGDRRRRAGALPGRVFRQRPEQLGARAHPPRGDGAGGNCPPAAARRAVRLLRAQPPVPGQPVGGAGLRPDRPARPGRPLPPLLQPHCAARPLRPAGSLADAPGGGWVSGGEVVPLLPASRHAGIGMGPLPGPAFPAGAQAHRALGDRPHPLEPGPHHPPGAALL